VPEWNEIVRKNLRNLRVTPEQREEVAQELAGHLEDLYEQLQESGHCESEALRLTMQATGNWKELAKKIRRAKREEAVMNKRTQVLWLPGLVAFTTASILLMTLQHAVLSRPTVLLILEQIVRLRPTLWWKDQVDVIYFCWWVLLPLCGAAGAYLSRRAGGTRLACIAASLFPSIIMSFVFCFVLPVSIVLEKNTFVMQHPLYFALAFVNWTMVPGLALILGALPFLWQKPRTQDQHRMAKAAAANL
jgi:hypothetical protein